MTWAERLAHVRKLIRAEARSKVDRSVVKVGDNCPACQANNDPDKVPVHPNCNCDVQTDNVELGLDSLGGRESTLVGTANLATAAELAVREVRYGDILRWSEQVLEEAGADDLLTFIVDTEYLTMLVQRVVQAQRSNTTVHDGRYRTITLPVSEYSEGTIAEIYHDVTS